MHAVAHIRPQAHRVPGPARSLPAAVPPRTRGTKGPLSHRTFGPVALFYFVDYPGQRWPACLEALCVAETCSRVDSLLPLYLSNGPAQRTPVVRRPHPVEDRTLSRTYRYSENDQVARPRRRRTGRGPEAPFRCTHCKAMVGPVPYGGSHRNHCPHCLYSRHVDGRVPGDRAATCGGSMSPIGAFQRPNGEHAVIHRCLTCRFERYNRIAADDYFELVLQLPAVQPRPDRPAPVVAAEERSA
jgi:hypothetical protein